jgi:hypothetical protein
MRADQRKFHIIYKTTCKVTGKWYIGMHSTDDLMDGYIGSGTYLWKSIKKHGKNEHVCEVLEYLPTRKALSEREEQIVSKETIADPMCMNFRTGGTGNQPGRTTFEATRKKRSVAMTQYWSDQEKRDAQSQRVKEWYKDETNRALVGEASRVQWADPIRRAAREASMKKASSSDQYSKNLSEAQTKRWSDPAQREQMSATMKDHWSTSEAKAKKSEGGRKRYQRQDERDKTAKQTKAAWDDPDIRAKRIAGLRASHAKNPRGKSCTIDGSKIYGSVKELIAALGAGKNGSRNLNFRYL